MVLSLKWIIVCVCVCVCVPQHSDGCVHEVCAHVHAQWLH